MFAPSIIRQQISATGRRPTALASGISIKFAVPYVAAFIPV
jgi:hypothetical protein